MDDAKRKEEWDHTGDICYAVAQSQSKSKIDRDLFNRYRQARKTAAGPVKTVKPSELMNIS